jgi:hypothetical protein
MKTASDTIVEALNGLAPRVALVLGSGLGGLVEAVENAVHVPYDKLRASRKRRQRPCRRGRRRDDRRQAGAAAVGTGALL